MVWAWFPSSGDRLVASGAGCGGGDVVGEGDGVADVDVGGPDCRRSTRPAGEAQPGAPGERGETSRLDQQEQDDGGAVAGAGGDAGGDPPPRWRLGHERQRVAVALQDDR